MAHPINRMQLRIAIVVVIGVFVGGFVLMVKGSDEQRARENASQQNPTSKGDPALAAPDHFYKFKEGHEFGYTNGSGDGVVQFVHFEGLNPQTGVMSLQHYDSNEMVQMWCKQPCDLVHVRTSHFGTGQAYSEQTINPQQGTILWAMVQDMLDGKMNNDVVR